MGIVDVHYDDVDGATAALAVSERPEFDVITHEFVCQLKGVAAYEPGAFYRRELPCLRAVVGVGPRLDVLIVDGYATLDPAGRPGLGAHASRVLGIPVIGLAKTAFHAATHAVPVLRGKALRPLYVTTAGDIDVVAAAALVQAMAGPHRVPDAVAHVDRLARRRLDPAAAPQILGGRLGACKL